MYDLVIFLQETTKKELKRQWFLNKKTHREKEPAVEYFDGENWWCKNGMLHRENNFPAIEYPNGDKEWWINGQRYILQENGTKEFIDFHGNLHRKDDLPAVEYPNGDKEWWSHGKRHRENGPAVIYGNKKFWFEHGEFIKCII